MATLFNTAPQAQGPMVYTFPELPTTAAELRALPQAAMSEPGQTAALTVLACCAWELGAETCYDMLNVLKGPVPLSPFQKQFLRDRLAGKAHVPRSYFDGTSPANDYMPTQPYTIRVQEGPYSYQNEGYASLWLHSSGADSNRPITLRHAKDGRWYLWGDITFLSDIRPCESLNPWG